MFPELTELLLIGCPIDLSWTPKSKSNTSTPKTQLADILTKGNVTLDEWNHLLCLFNISHCSSTNCFEAMSKRTQKDSGEERVTAKSKPMMNLVSRCSVRNPYELASTTSESRGKPDMKVKYLCARGMSSNQERGDLFMNTNLLLMIMIWTLTPTQNQHYFSTMFIWVALKENVRLARILWIITEVCSNQGFLLELWKSDQKQKPQET